MATNIVLKRSSTSGAVPSTSDLALGEIAINTYDGKMYTKKTVSGSSSIVELTGNVALSSSAFDLINYKFTATSNQTSFSGSDANSNTLAYASGTIQVFLNGILLDPTDYTATNGTHVVLDTGANSGEILYISRFDGVNPFEDFKYVASSNQTSFSGDDANSNSLIYTVGNLAVYLNGVLLDPTDYTATTGTSVVLASGANSGDILHIHEFNQTGLTEVHADSSPTLGGDLDMHTFDLVTTDNRNIDIIPHGTGDVNLSTDTVKIGASGENVIVTTNGTGDITLSTNAGTNSGTVKILDGANQNIEITPNGSGKINLDGLLWPNADGSANQFIQTDGSGNLSFVDVLDTSEEIQDTVGAMFTNNTETGITATYQDADGTIDLVVGTLNQDTTGSAATLTTPRNIHGVAFDGSANIDLSEVIQDTVGAMFSSNTETNISATYEDGDGTIDLVVPNTLSNVTELGTLTHLDVDNLNLNGNTLTSASSDFIIDASHNIVLDTDGAYIQLKDGGTSFGELRNSSTDFIIKSTTQDKDIFFKGNDGGAEITALTLDMSAAGAATFNDKITAVGTSVFTNLDISGDVDIDGTLEADAITVNGTTLSETIADTVGAMVTSNTESGITVAYQDADNTLDFTIGTLNQNTTGSAATLTTARTIGGVSFDGSANINLPGVNTAGNQNTTGSAATVTTAAQPNITSLGTLTTLTVDDITINGSTISDAGTMTIDVGGDLILDAAGNDIILKDNGTTFGQLTNDSGQLIIYNGGSQMLKGASGSNAQFVGTVGVGVADPTTYNASDKLALYSTGNTSMVIAAGTSSESSIFLADGTSGAASYDGYIQYDHGDRELRIAAEAVMKIKCDSAVTLYYNNGSKFSTNNNGVAVNGKATGTLTTDNDGSFDMNASNNFKCTPSGNFTLTFTNISAQSGNILLINSGGHTVSAHTNTKVDANILGTISTAGTYLLAYFSDGTNVYMTNSAVYT